ncbi:uncharacterized protein LOC111691802 [Anoplophora glabripennis]|uniref:uncharacterized protein LOC111691802 n=1 Tax=Anoplophora glabripennis TaxID=217634 RepID=UPI000C773098|nr:uncharacterized protein LOC111691802 [Anoplophora glabripennis]
MCTNTLDAVSCLYPTYIYSLLMGFAPFKIERKGPFVEIKHCKLYHVLSTLFYTLSICFLVWMGYTKMGYYHLQSPMQRFINFLYLLLVAGLMSVNVLFNKLHTTSLVTLWRKMYHIDTLIRTRGIKLKYRRLMYSTSTFCIVAATLHTCYIIFLVSIQNYKDPLFSGSVYFALNFAVTGFACVSCSFHAFFLLIGHMFEKILEYMEHRVLRSFLLDSDSKSKSIIDTAVLHQELCQLVRHANDVMSVQMLASFAVTFSVVTLQIYSMVNAFNIKKVDYSFLLSSLFCVIILLQEKLILSLVSRRCMGMVSKD